MEDSDKISSKIIGAAGEHYVMFQLLRRNLIAALAPEGVPNMDIIVTDINSKKLCSIQVKTRRDIGNDKGWHMKAKHETILSSDLFYCFVNLGDGANENIETFIIPSETVAEVLREDHKNWLETPGKNGNVHNDSVMRRLKPAYPNLNEKFKNKYADGWMDKYKDNWDQIR